MVPSAFVVLKDLPRTPNGKLDRRALPVPDFVTLPGAKYEAPQGYIEQMLATHWQALLQIDQVGRDDKFFELGGHSLLAIKVLQKVNSTFSADLRVVDLYQSPTIRQLAARISGSKGADGLVDLSQEATLGAELVPPLRIPFSPPQTVLLTGCTGFVGRFLLARLLEATQAKVFCLIRSNSQAEAAARLRTVLVSIGLQCDEYSHRIVPIRGDMALPSLGLDAETYQNVSRETDSIFHCATRMNHLETYDMAKAANVDGIREILKIATTAKLKLVNYISTLGVFSDQYSDRSRVVSEFTSIDHELHKVSQGYVASKWVGEKILMIAQERGIACNIFRVGLVWADSELGRYDELQREDRFLRSCLLSGFGIKAYCYDPPPAPVDYVARAIVWLASQHPDGAAIFHICSSQPPVRDVFERCNTVAGTSLQLLPFYEWIGEIKKLHHHGRTLPAVPLIDFAFSMNEAAFDADQGRLNDAKTRFDCAQTERELKAAGIVIPGVSDELLSRCVKGMLSKQDLTYPWGHDQAEAN